MNRRILSFSTAVIVSSAGLVASTSPALAACVDTPPVAHRGGTERYVENTGNAFRDAGNRGVPLWETDVQFTSDDVPVIMHDATVDRTTNGTGAVADLTYAQIAALRTSDDQPVMTLAQLVNDAAVDGAKVFVETKTDPTEAQWATFFAALSSRPNMTSKLVITSFDGPTILAAKAHSAAYATGLIQDVGDQTAASVTQYGTHILIKHHNAITSSRMTNWTAGGLQVYSWTVDTVSEMDRMSWYPKIAGVITNVPGGYLTWQRGRDC